MNVHSFLLLQSLSSNRGLPAQQNQLDSVLLNLTAFFVPMLMGSMSSWMLWKWKVTAWPSWRGPMVVILIWGEKKIIPQYHPRALWKVESYLSLYNYHFIILWERINLLIACSYVSHSLLWVNSEGKCWIKKKTWIIKKSQNICVIFNYFMFYNKVFCFFIFETC